MEMLSIDEFEKKDLPMSYARLNKTDIIGWDDCFNIVINKWLANHVISWWFRNNSDADVIWFGAVNDCKMFIEWIETQPLDKKFGELG